MKKKGFTLVELLAVIILIGLIAVLVVPKVTKTLKDSKESVNKSSVNGLVRTANNYYIESKMKGSFQGCSYNFTNNTNTCEGLEFTGEKPEKGKLNINEDGIVSLSVKFEKNVI